MDEVLYVQIHYTMKQSFKYIYSLYLNLFAWRMSSVGVYCRLCSVCVFMVKMEE